MRNDEFNPIRARHNRIRARGKIVSILAVMGILAAGTIAVSAAQGQKAEQPKAEPVAVAQATEIRTASAEQPQQRRNVRVIPLFNTPANPTGK